MLLGAAIGDGLSESYRHWGDSDPLAVGLVTALERLETGFVETEEWTLAGLTKLVTRGHLAAVVEDIPGTGTIIRVDESLGVGRPDLICRDAHGQLWITDTKVSLTIDPRYRASRLAEFETDHQLWHYAWEAEQFYGERVVMVGVHQIILSPKTISTRFDFPVTPERLAFWLKGAEQAWRDRAEEEAGQRPVVPRFSSCWGKYGRCEYLEACHQFNLDPKKMDAYYTTV